MKTIATLAAASLTAMASANVYNGVGGALNDNNVNAGVTTFNINVADAGALNSISVTLTGLNHAWVGDLAAEVTHNAVTVSLFFRIGYTGSGFGDSSNFNGNYTFKDAGPYGPNATGSLWNEATLGDSTYNLRSGSYYASGGNPGNQTFLSLFNGTDVNGTWTIKFTDFATPDAGSLTSWSLDLGFVPSPGAMALLGVAGLCGRCRRA